jgi:hypothetical protein
MRRQIRRRLLRPALAMLLLVQAGAPLAEAQRRFLGQPILVRITGYLGPKRDKPILVTSWKVNRDRAIYDWHVVKLDVLSGNTAYFNIVTQLDFYSPAFSIAGDDKAVAAFLATPPGDMVVAIGYLRIDAAVRILMLDTVEPLVATTPTPAATP